MKISLISILILIIFSLESFSQSSTIEEKALQVFVDSALSKIEYKDLKIYFSGETKDVPSSMNVCPGCVVRFFLSEVKDTSLYIYESNKERDSEFWFKMKGVPIPIEVIKPIKQGRLRGYFFLDKKRSMTVYRRRELGDYSLLSISLSVKDMSRGESFCFFFDSEENLIRWCSATWVN